jgi:hypothetical protein
MNTAYENVSVPLSSIQSAFAYVVASYSNPIVAIGAAAVASEIATKLRDDFGFNDDQARQALGLDVRALADKRRAGSTDH